MNRVFVAVGLGVVIGLLGVVLLVFGYTALGIIILVISASLTLGILTPRQQSSRSSSSGRGSFYGGAAGSTGGYGDGNDGGDGGGDGGGFDGAVVAASTGVAAGEVREGLRGVTARGWAGCYHALGHSTREREGDELRSDE